MRLTKKYLKLAKKNKRVITRLTLENNKSYPTVMRWFDNNSEMLTTATSLNIICDELHVTQEQILENIPV